MCLVKVSKDDDNTEPPRPVTYVRRRPSPSIHSTHRASKVIIQHGSTSHHSIPLDLPRPSQYVIAPVPGPSSAPDAAPPPITPLPMIIHAPTPPHTSPRTSHTHVVTVHEGSPRTSRTSVHSRHSARSHRSRRDSRGTFIVTAPGRTRSRSPAGKFRHVRGSGSVDHGRREEERPRSREPSRERRSKVYLSTPLTEREVERVARGLEGSRDEMKTEEARPRGRSITYEAGPRVSVGRLAERERVLVDEDGRRREFYKTTSLGP